MGSLRDEIARAVPLGEKIGCVVPSDAPLVASVSNWGGYALCCAVAVLTWDARVSAPSAAAPADGGGGGGAGSADDAEAAAHLQRFVPDREAARRSLLACSAAGAVDGITAAGDGSVDGMPLEAQLEVLDDLRAIAIEAMRSCKVV